MSISMTVGDLYDALKEIERWEKRVEEAEFALSHGGNPTTVARKQAYVQEAQRMLKAYRDQIVMNAKIVDPNEGEKLLS